MNARTSSVPRPAAPHPAFRKQKTISSICFSLALALVFAQFCLAQNSVTERIHYGDLVDVDVVGSFEFDWRGSVTPEGFLDGLDRVENPVFALCKTEKDVAASIFEQYNVFLKNPSVVVRIIDRSNRALAYVNGAVKKPQRLQLRRTLKLTELIVISGGITDSSSGEITIFRPPNVNCSASIGQAPTRISIRIADLLIGDAQANVHILSGDIVTVVEAPPVFLTGDVAVPKRMNLTPDLTLTRAIAAAGGVSKDSDSRKVRIHRRKGETRVLEFDIRAIQEKKAEDPKLEPYDVIDVEQKGGSRRPAPFPEADTARNVPLARLPLRIVD